MKISAVILAGGSSTRFGASIPKPFMSLNGKAVIQYSIDVFEPLVDEIVIVTNGQYKNYKCVSGGQTRNESAYNGLMASTGDFVIIHDGATLRGVGFPTLKNPEWVLEMLYGDWKTPRNEKGGKRHEFRHTLRLLKGSV